MKKTWNKLYDKVSKIDTSDFTEEEMENIDTFTLAVKYHMDEFLKSQRHNALLTCKNARYCPAWTKEDN